MVLFKHTVLLPSRKRIVNALRHRRCTRCTRCNLSGPCWGCFGCYRFCAFTSVYGKRVPSSSVFRVGMPGHQLNELLCRSSPRVPNESFFRSWLDLNGSCLSAEERLRLFQFLCCCPLCCCESCDNCLPSFVVVVDDDSLAARLDPCPQPLPHGTAHCAKAIPKLTLIFSVALTCPITPHEEAPAAPEVFDKRGTVGPPS